MSNKIFLTCPECKRHKSVKREKTDPPEAISLETLCPECCGGDFSQDIFFDKNGKHITRDYTV